MVLLSPAAQAAWDVSNITFDDSQAADVQTVSYNGTDIDALVLYEENFDELSGSVLATARVWIQSSDIAAPDYRDSLIIDSETWRVRKIVQGDGNVWELTLYLDERPYL